jgi:hypothetical protein|tara:strand:- start:21957 stop:22172 length:216 start_codon:yes stop_codon:yes gene_type:complete
MKLSNQAMGALMMALQKSLMEQSDITGVLNQFNFSVDKNEQLVVENPPVLRFVDNNDDPEKEKIMPKEEDF